MSQRVPRPLRLLDRHSSTDGIRGVVGCRNPRLIAAYKPCGLPYFAKCQIADCDSVDGVPHGSGGARRLFSASLQSLPAVAPTDLSDSFISRLTDMLSPSSGKPRVVLPLVHPALARHASASQLNAIMAQRKGTTMVACYPEEFMFFRNCHRLGVVRYVYRVLCRLPPCVSGRLRQSIQYEEAMKKANVRGFKNPYVRQVVDERSGGAFGCNDSGISLGGSLPPCAQPYSLLSGGFYCVRSSALLKHGKVTGYLSGVRMPAEVQHAVRQQERLKGLFLSPPPSTAGNSPSPSSVAPGECCCDVCRSMARHYGDVIVSGHSWITDDCRLRVSLDVRDACSSGAARRALFPRDENFGASAGCVAALESNRGSRDTRLCGKSFGFDFRLIKLNEACDIALYEVSTSDASDEEIKAAFAAANLYVVNDYVNDHTLAAAMLSVAQQLHRLPLSKLTNLPMVVQNSLREGSPEELVAGPLLANSLQGHIAGDRTLPAIERGSQPQGSGHPALGEHRHRLLLEVLSLTDEETYTRVMHLVFGSGLECAAIHFPDPYHESTTHAVQHLLQVMDGGELTTAHRDAVAERLSYASCGVTSNCETYDTLLLPRRGGQTVGVGPGGKNGALIPGKDELVALWGRGCPVELRAEEVGELLCVYCGATGHVWSACPRGAPLLEAGSYDGNGADKSAVASSVAQTTRVDAVATVDDVQDAISLGRGKCRSDAGIVSIPNAVPSQTFNPHAWHHNEKRPRLHRSRVRCAYCSGKHHISQCPKLSGCDKMNGEIADDDLGLGVDRDQLQSNAKSLFCIKCGEHGHLYAKCPQIPEGLHPAVNCPICQHSLRKVHHTPSRCPRRVSPPPHYTPSGLPLRLVQSMGGAGRRKKTGGYGSRGGDSSAVLLSDSFLSQKVG